MAKLTTKERKSLPDSAFGIPSRRAFPLIDAKHVRSAIRFFNDASPKERPILAKNILAKAKKYGVKINPSSKLARYAPVTMLSSSGVKEASNIGTLSPIVGGIPQETQILRQDPTSGKSEEDQYTEDLLQGKLDLGFQKDIHSVNEATHPQQSIDIKQAISDTIYRGELASFRTYMTQSNIDSIHTDILDNRVILRDAILFYIDHHRDQSIEKTTTMVSYMLDHCTDEEQARFILVSIKLKYPELFLPIIHEILHSTSSETIPLYINSIIQSEYEFGINHEKIKPVKEFSVFGFQVNTFPTDKDVYQFPNDMLVKVNQQKHILEDRRELGRKEIWKEMRCKPYTIKSNKTLRLLMVSYMEHDNAIQGFAIIPYKMKGKIEYFPVVRIMNGTIALCDIFNYSNKLMKNIPLLSTKMIWSYEHGKMKEIPNKDTKLRHFPLMNFGYQIEAMDTFTLLKVRAKDFLRGIRLSEDGNVQLDMTNRLTFDHYEQVHTIIKQNQKEDNVEAVKENLAYIFTMISTIDENFMDANTLPKKDERDTMVRLRALYISDFKLYTRYVMKKDHHFNFMAYYQNSPMNKNTFTIDKKKLRQLSLLLRTIML